VPQDAIDLAFLSPDTRELIATLHKHGVRYLIVGGAAVIYYGHIRTTGDVDFFYDRSAENAQRIYAALDEFWAGHIPNLGRWQELTADGMILQFGVPPNRIDFINNIDGVDFAAAWPKRLTLPLKVGEVFLISLEDLIRNKEASGRPRDIEDVKFLRRARV
jgi:hypothetical protein